MPTIFLRNIHSGVSSIEDGHNEKSKLLKKLSNINENENQSKIKYFLKNVGEKVLNSFKSNIFPTKNSTPEPTPNAIVFNTPEPTEVKTKNSKKKSSAVKLHEEFVNEIVNDRKDINDKVFSEYLSIKFQHFRQ